MKKYLLYIALFIVQTVIIACTDTTFTTEETGNDNNVRLKLSLNIPIDNGVTRGFVYGPDQEESSSAESTINDIYVLAFDQAKQTYLGRFTASYNNGNVVATINAETINFGNEITIMLLTNLEEQPNSAELISAIERITKGTPKANVLKALKYTFTEKWDITKRRLPMWGETNITPIQGTVVEGSVNLYRAVSKINVVVNNGEALDKDVFKLKSVRVYYARTSGLAGSLHAPENNPEGAETITATSIPENVSYFPRYTNDTEPNSLCFEAEREDCYAIENQIYVPESNQQGEEPMCLVVGGYYNGSKEETFYRVDFKEGNKGSEFYDAIRNHIYVFNINSASRPGTPDPDPALDHVVAGLDVTVKVWTPEYMQGIGGQYTLDVSTGGFVLDASNTGNNEILVKTSNTGGWSLSGKSASWFTLNETANGVTVRATQNYGGARYGTFIIQSGNLQKVITVRQKGKGTANCYIVSDDGSRMQQDLIVTVKGNGEAGLVADGVALNERNAYISVEDIADVKLIWETSDGLVTIAKGQDGKAILDPESGIIKYSINLTKENSNIQASNQLNSQKYKGGNALIGAFGRKGNGDVDYNNLLWSWHIWVCPDLDTDGDGYVDNDELSAKDEKWATGYTFMDRNMGALGNEPGLASLGLLYQWGRKDPFIGAGKVVEGSDKMYTNRPLANQGFDWKNSTNNMSVDAARKSPTTLIKGTLTGTDYQSLWGTAKGLDGEENAGNKTIYDPCPYGYRVPNVGAIIFEGTGHANIKNSDSSKDNWYSNNEFWPLKIVDTDRNGWDYYEYISGCSSYGFWLRYDTHSTEPSITQYSNIFKTNKQDRDPKKPMTWLPISGVYDGSIAEFAKIDKQSTLESNSIMWTNSSISLSDNSKRPAGLFLHGVKNSESDFDGNHLHMLKQKDGSLYAKPQQAGALRCVRDVKVNLGDNAIKVPSGITLAAKVGDEQTATLTSLQDDWEVIDPGAMWFVMTPDAGPAGSAQTLTFKSTQPNTGAERTANIKIRFNDGKGTVKSIKVTQKKGYSTTEVSKTSMSFAGYIGWGVFTSPPSPQTFAITADEDISWEITGPSWCGLNPSKGFGYKTVNVQPEENNTRSSRSGTITIKFSNNVTKTIAISQSTKKQ